MKWIITILVVIIGYAIYTNNMGGARGVDNRILKFYCLATNSDKNSSKEYLFLYFSLIK